MSEQIHRLHRQELHRGLGAIFEAELNGNGCLTLSRYIRYRMTDDVIFAQLSTEETASLVRYLSRAEPSAPTLDDALQVLAQHGWGAVPPPLPPREESGIAAVDHVGVYDRLQARQEEQAVEEEP